MIPLALAGAGISAGSSLASYWGRKKYGNFADTAQAKNLARIGQQGIISPTERSALLGRMSGTLGNRANIQKTSLRGRLASRGMGNSIAGLSAVSSVDKGTTKSLADYMQNIGIMNERSKEQALAQRAGLADAHRMGKMDYESQGRQSLIQGLTGAGMQGLGAMQTPQGLQIPENFGQMSIEDAYTWSVNNGLPWEDVEQVWYDMLDNNHYGSVSAPIAASTSNFVMRGLGMF